MAQTPRWQAFLQDEAFPGFKRWIIDQTGLAYYQDKERELAFAMERCYADDPELPVRNVFRLLQTTGPALNALVEQLTIGETFFFRHVEMFHALRDFVLPDLVRRKSGARSLRIWSAGCSIGAEPYSLSILLREEMAAQFAGWTINILGTDINRRFLRIAETAAYDAWALRGVSGKILDRCFEKRGKKWHLAEAYRQGVHFLPHNLVADYFPDVSKDLFNFDLIICRNVMIYFDPGTNQRLVDQFHDALIPGGWLAVGHAEPHTETFRAFRTINAPGAVLYQRRPPGESPESSSIPKAPPPVTVWRPPLPPPEPVRTQPTVATPRIAPPPPKPMPSPSVAPPGLDSVAALADHGDVVAARRRCERLLAEAPMEAPVHLYYGILMVQLGDWEEATQALRRCLYLDRNLPLAHYYLGLAQERLGRDGSRHFRNGLELLQPFPADELVREGHGLTVHELRTLLCVSLSAAA